MNCITNGCQKPIKYKLKQLCDNCYQRQWRAENPDKLKAQHEKYYANNKDRVREQARKWRKNNIEHVRKTARIYMANNRHNPVTQEHMTDKVKKRFFDKVNKTNNCWIWTGARTAYRPKRVLADPTLGYGVITVNNRPFYAHRLSWLIHKGPLIPGLVVDHLCDNSLCVNPDHLQHVTNTENTMRSPKHSKYTKYYWYKETCKWGHPRGPEAKGKICPGCYQEMLKKRRKRV